MTLDLAFNALYRLRYWVYTQTDSVRLVRVEARAEVAQW